MRSMRSMIPTWWSPLSECLYLLTVLPRSKIFSSKTFSKSVGSRFVIPASCRPWMYLSSPLATCPGNRGPNSTAGKFAYGSNATAERRNKYKRQHFSSTSKNAVHNKSATQGKVVSGLCVVRFNNPCFFDSVSNSKLSGSLPPLAPHAARMDLYLSSVWRLPGWPRTTSRPLTLNLKWPRFT